MLKVILYDHTRDLYQPDILENTELSMTYVFPHPQLADDFRDRFNELGLLDKRDVITISNFIKGQLKDDENFAKNYKTKADLIPCLIPEWKKHIDSPTFEKFLHTFNLFTDLRSFTLDFNLVENILTEFDVEVAKGLLIFWTVMENDGLIDEHQAYNLISTNFDQKIYPPEKKNLFFWGFGHLSALQIEMVQALANFHDVYIPFPKNAFIKAHSTDWINWLDSTLIHDFQEIPRKLKGKYSFFPKNKMSQYLREQLKPKNKTDFYLMSKDISMEDINEIPQAGLNFKVKNDLFKNKIKDIFFAIKDAGTESLENYIEKQIEGEKENSFDAKDFRKLKIYLLIKEVLKEYSGTTLFDLRVIEYIVDLKAPRTFSAPILTSEEFGEIRGINRLGFYNPDIVKIICVNSNYSPIKTSGSRYPEKVEEFLKALGPIQNNFMEYLQIKEHILEILEDERSIFFLEEGLQESDLAWEEIFSQIKGNELSQKKEENKLPSKIDYLLPFIKEESFSLKSISAKKLQTYIDCPRKYYFTYPGKINPYIEISCIFTPADLGRMEHEVMDLYFRENDTWDPEKHMQVIKSVFEKHLMKKSVPDLAQRPAWVEVSNYTENGIKEILKLLKIYPEAKLEFEKELREENVKGFMDLLLTTPQGVGLIDFKRSIGGMATKGELLGFKEIQLWFYLNHLEMKKDILFLGYLGMAHPDDSIYLVNGPLLKDRMESEKFCNPKRIYTAETSIEEELKKYAGIENNIIKEIKSDNSWKDKPQTSSSCKYCVIETVCPKGNL